MRVERLFNIVTILLTKDTVSAKELAERFNVSTRTIYRDIDILSVSGIPVYMKKGYNGGISLMNDYKLDKAMLSDSDVESIMMSIGALGATNLDSFNTALEKFSAVFTKHQVTDWVEIDFTDWSTDNKRDTRIEDIKRAILDRRLIRISYFNSYGQKKSRVLAPLKLIFKSRAWYISAYCIEKKDIRIFKIHRMKDLELLDEHFNREEYLQIKPQIKDSARKPNIVKLKMKFKEDVLYLLYDWYDDNDIEKTEDGHYIVNTEFPMDEWVYSHILAYGDKVEVLEPLFIREQIKKRLKNILQSYN
jgi:predicted DNA-binding transcriptional regulator YafY